MNFPLAMTAITFDTLTYAKRLRDAGFTEQQAEAQAEALHAVVDENLATKRDVEQLRCELKGEMKQMESRLRLDLAENKADLLKWIAGLLIFQAGFIVTLIKLL